MNDSLSDSFILEVECMAHGGAAMGRHAGRVIFVPGLLPGESARVTIVNDRGRFAHGRALEVLSASPARVEPRCFHPGPTSWQHIEYAQQVIFKHEIVIDQLQRIGKFTDPPVGPVIEAAQPWGYRHWMSFDVAEDGRFGFWSEDDQTVIPVDGCSLLHPALTELFSQLDLDEPELTRLRLQMGSDPADRMVIIQTADDLAPEIEVDLPISLNLLLSDNEPVSLIGSPQVNIQLLHRTFRATAGSFTYPNVGMLPTLLEQVLHYLPLTGEETFLDLYSGIGIFTAFLAEHADLVVSVESYPPAVTDAEDNTADLENIDLVEGSAEEVLDDLIGPFDAILADPPPSGMSVEVIDALARLDAPRLVIISADPATLARDAQRLTRHGYTLTDVQPIDMDPQTAYITTIATLER